MKKNKNITKKYKDLPEEQQQKIKDYRKEYYKSYYIEKKSATKK